MLSVPLERQSEALVCTRRTERIAAGKREVQSETLAHVLAASCGCVFFTGSFKSLWRVRRNKYERRLFGTAAAAADCNPSDLEVELSRTWPAWTQNSCRRLSQVPHQGLCSHDMIP